MKSVIVVVGRGRRKGFLAPFVLQGKNEHIQVGGSFSAGSAI